MLRPSLARTRAHKYLLLVQFPSPFFLLHLSPSRHSYTNFDTSTLISHGFQELEEIDPRLQAGEEGVRRLVANALSSYYRRVGF
jgi:hypothetical protein